MNDFEEFAAQFRRRTVQRLLEFEKNLDKAQRGVEQAATRSMPRTGINPTHTNLPGGQHRPAGAGNRQVKGVLRRD